MVGKALKVGDAVRGNEDRAIFTLHRRKQFGEDLSLRDRVQAHRGLVEDQQLRAPREGKHQRQFDAGAERQGQHSGVRMQSERLHQLLAVLVVPCGIKPLDERDDSPDASPRRVREFRPHVSGPQFHRLLVATMVQPEGGDGSRVFLSQTEYQVDRRRLARAVGADETVDGAHRHGQIQRAEGEGTVRLLQAANLKRVCGHVSALLMRGVPRRVP